ncbi:hypothetical protein [Nocardiopsis sp. FIRDI 009]|uniref:hypothetical protein n=1 Tax=Nocardiopsis sp. FIRDI 009 TaxID=714197 RepID=UPI0013007284|nr:hypothetical protein [Nocardiopsis sp. FIRDI 009]
MTTTPTADQGVCPEGGPHDWNGNVCRKCGGTWACGQMLGWAPRHDWEGDTCSRCGAQAPRGRSLTT